MKIRKLTSEDDWSYGHSESDYLTEQQGTGLNIITRLREWTNDCFFALSNGIDYPTRLGSFNQKEALDNDVKNIIYNTQDVVDITFFESIFDESHRHYSFQANVVDIYSSEAFSISFSTEDTI